MARCHQPVDSLDIDHQTRQREAGVLGPAVAAIA
jgi:hypothetical protein